MKISILLGTILIFFAFERVNGQLNYFEGKIVFKTSFEIKDSTKRAVHFSTLYPSITTQYFKEGNTFEIYDKGDNKTYLYLPSENKAYQNKWSKDTLYFFDCGSKGREILNYSLTKNAATVLGLACDKLQITYSTGTSTYYFNENRLRINPEWYSQLTYINWDTISKFLKSIALKTVIDRPDYRIVNTATSVKNEKIPSSIFQIPKNAILIEDK
jgi:hypothetical protein